MDQRYTGFDHAAQKKSKQKLPAADDKKNPLVNAEIIKDEEIVKLLLCSASFESTKPAPRSGSLVFTAKTGVANAFNKSYSKNTSIIRSEAKNYRTKKTFHEKSAATKGLVGGALRLFITIIILVVVIMVAIAVLAAVT